MGLTKYKLGELIEEVVLRNKDIDNKYTEKNVKGISTDKKFIETKANLVGVSLNSYRVVNPMNFAYVTDTSRRGDKISLAFNNTNEVIIVSSISTIFKVKREELLDPSFLFMYFNRPEFDRFSRFNSWGSARETFSWEDFCDIEINLPSIEIQRKYVAIYQAMLKNQKAYEEGLEDLKLACDGTIEKLKHNSKKRMLGDFIIETNIKNEDGTIKKALGVESTGNFMNTRAKMEGVNIKNYSIVNKNDFAYNPSRINLGSIARYEDEDSCIVSPMYSTFKVVSKTLNPLFLSLWFSRKEFHRYTWYYSTGSVRDLFDINLMKEMYIPYPDISIQNSISDIYKVYTERKEINEKLKDQIKSICPILIKGAMEEASREEV